jgi:hypothetical protein
MIKHNKAILSVNVDLQEVISSYTTIINIEYILAGRLSFYFLSPTQLKEILMSLNIGSDDIIHDIYQTIISYKRDNFIDIYNLNVSENVKEMNEDDYFETFMLDINGYTILTTLYNLEHSRGFHRNNAILTELSKKGYPLCLAFIGAVIINLQQIKSASLNITNNIKQIMVFMEKFYYSCRDISNQLTCNIDIYDTTDMSVIELIKNIINRINGNAFFNSNAALSNKLIAMLNDALQIYTEKDKLTILNGYCIGHIHWNNIYIMSNKKAMIYDFTKAHYGNLLAEYSKLITRLLCKQQTIDIIIDNINQKDNKIFANQLENLNLTIRLKHLLIYCIIDTINIIIDASQHYVDMTPDNSGKETIYLQQIDSISNLLLTLSIEFKPYYQHPEIMLSNGKITLYDLCNIQITYLSKLISLTANQEKTYVEQDIALPENIELDFTSMFSEGEEEKDED